MYSSYPDSDKVIGDLGETFVNTFIDAVDGARDDFAEFRTWKPGWFPSFTGRFTANFLHERIWDRMVRELDGSVGVHVVDREPIRELHQGTRYIIRLKRHHPGDRISSYPTEGSSAFWSNSDLTLDGLEAFSLAIGYMWDAELRAMGEAVLSFRDGKNNPVWAVRLGRDSAAPAGFIWTPVDPTLPELDLSRIAVAWEEELGS